MTLPSASVTDATSLWTDIMDRLVLDGASCQEPLDALVDVVDVPVADWPGHAILVAVGIQADVLASNTEPDVVGLDQVGLDTQDRAVQLFRLGQILDRVDHVS